jgi:radical SAM superfamily enzyme YgiQ (UPF0313 family)
VKYEGLIIRPPSEADSLILQIAVGCSHNTCTFCPAYKKKHFRIKKLEEIYRDIDTAAHVLADDVRRVFLCDGDPLIIPQKTLLPVLQRINERFDKLLRVGIYANAGSILKKSSAELKELREQKLGIVYMGLESGDAITLERVKKGATIEQMIEAAQKVNDAGIKLSVTVILGLGGAERSEIHARETMRVLNRMKPQHIGALTLMIVEDSPLHKELASGAFLLPGPFELISELRMMLEESQLEKCVFYSNHASNYLPLRVRLPQGREKALQEIDAVLKNKDLRMLTPEFYRAL